MTGINEQEVCRFFSRGRFFRCPFLGSFVSESTTYTMIMISRMYWFFGLNQLAKLYVRRTKRLYGCTKLFVEVTLSQKTNNWIEKFTERKLKEANAANLMIYPWDGI